MDFLANLKKLLGIDQEMPRGKAPAPQQISGVSDPIGQRSTATQMPLNGAVSDPGVRVAEDDFTFPQGGQFIRRTDGRAYINGGVAEPGARLQEDNFTFGNTLPAPRPVVSPFEELLRRYR